MTYRKGSSSATSNFSIGSPRCTELLRTCSRKLHLNTPLPWIPWPYLGSLCFSEQLFIPYFSHLCSVVGMRLGDQNRLGELEWGLVFCGQVLI